MRKLLAPIFALAAFVVAAPAEAQTYDSRYSVCIHVYGSELGDRIECIYTSLEQCAASAVGIPATCLVNPYFERASEFPPARPRKHVR